MWKWTWFILLCLLVPKNVTIKITTQVENNAFLVECTDLKKEDWRGPKGSYHATITPGVHKKIQNRSCFFQFGDLSYSTGYTVSVGVTTPSRQTYPGMCRTLFNWNSCVFRSSPSMEWIPGKRWKSNFRPAVCILQSLFRIHTWSHLRKHSAFLFFNVKEPVSPLFRLGFEHFVI